MLIINNHSINGMVLLNFLCLSFQLVVNTILPALWNCGLLILNYCMGILLHCSAQGLCQVWGSLPDFQPYLWWSSEASLHSLCLSVPGLPPVTFPNQRCWCHIVFIDPSLCQVSYSKCKNTWIHSPLAVMKGQPVTEGRKNFQPFRFLKRHTPWNLNLIILLLSKYCL